MGQAGEQMSEDLLKIKAFSELTGLSIRTLQYYDELGLLSPETKDSNGFRFYGMESFSKAFIIRSLKEIGMSLDEIRQYLLADALSITEFVDKEIRRKEDEMIRLQKQLMLLKNMQKNLSKDVSKHPSYIPLLSTDLSMEDFFSEVNGAQWKQPNIDLNEFQQFLADLDACRVHALSMEHELVQECLSFWRCILNVWGEHQDQIVAYSERNYQEAENTYGMTAENYDYLKRMLREAEEEQ